LRISQSFILLQMSNMPVKKARDWNTNDQKSGYCGFVTAFDIDSEFLSQYELYMVGSSQHQEYWIPAKELGLFNSAIAGRIEIVEGYFGMQFTGFVPDELGVKGKNAIDQFNVLRSLLDYAPFDLSCETSANRKAFFVNYLFWAAHDFTNVGITNAQRDDCLKQIRNYWIFNKIPVPLPDVR